MAGRGKGSPRSVPLGVPASPKGSAGVAGGGGFYKETADPPPPCYPFVIPKSSETQALRPGAAPRRQTGRPRLAQHVGSPEPKRTKLGTGGHVQTPAAAERLETKAKRRTVRVAAAFPSV